MEAYETLEREFASFTAGVEPSHMVACSSGTAALHLALEALRLTPNSEVLVPDYTMVACARAVTLAGLRPTFIDCEIHSLLVAPKTYELGLGWHTSAIMAVHIYGRQCDMDGIHSVARPKGIYVIEDMAELHGYLPCKWTDAACWSFYKNKVIAGEEGGAVYFKERPHAELARCLRSQGFTNAHDFTHVPRGHNYRLANCLAEKVLASMTQFKRNIVNRRQLEAEYDAQVMRKFEMVSRPPRQSPWVYDLRFEGMTTELQDKLVSALNREGISARHGFKPMSTQEEYKKHTVIGVGNARRLASEIIYLPLPSNITAENERKALAEKAFTTIQGTLRDGSSSR